MSIRICEWCNSERTAEEMRYEGTSNGMIPKTCRQCRDGNPSLSWCTYHGQPHDRGEFVKHANARNGLDFTCKRVKQLYRDVKHLTCVSCGSSKPSWSFSGSSHKSPTCGSCEEDRPDQIWCLGCNCWLDASRFPKGHRCYTCRISYRHGTTVASILARQGSTKPECACCGETENLNIDHDHACCPGVYGCDRCVRGYLCRACNTAEGLMRTSRRACLLATYMAKHGV